MEKDIKKAVTNKDKESDEVRRLRRTEDKWSEAESIVNKNKAEMWRINKQFIDEQYRAGREFWFSHDPYSPKTVQYFSDEVSYLIDLGVKDFEKIGDLWRAVW